MGYDPLTSVTKFVHEKQRISIAVPSTVTFPSAGAAVTTTGAHAIADTAITLHAATDYADFFNDGDTFHIGTHTKLYKVMSGGGTVNIVADQGLQAALTGTVATYRVRTKTTQTFNAQTHITTMTKSMTDLQAIAGTDIAAGGLVFELEWSNLVYNQQSYNSDIHLFDKYIVITNSAGATATAPVYIRSLAAPDANDQFFVTYYDPYGGMWNTTTQTITTSVTADATSLQNSLRSLPMRVLDDVTVAGYNAANTLANGYHEDGSAKTQVTNAWEFIVSFVGTTGTSGFQHLFEVEGRATGAGSFPLSNGLFTSKSKNTHGTSYAVVSKEGQSGRTSLDRSELSTCSNRGICDAATGQCTCFTGFRGLACEFQEALV
jgi:hypothetical protein